MGSTLTIRTPADFELARDVCSYGYFLLAPNHWDTRRRTLSRTLDVDGLATSVTVRQKSAGVLSARFDAALDRARQSLARAQLSRMLRLDEDEAELAEFHRVDRRWKKSGRGRLFRSATLFEDVVKTVTSCNVAWPSTIRMNMRLCEVFGKRSASKAPAFPTEQKLARARPATLRARCGVGYRDARLVELAKKFMKGEIDEGWLSDASTADDEVFAFLKSLPGIGPYAAGNIMMLLGRYSRLALDTESVRHGKAVLGMEGTEAQLYKQLAAHYEPFGRHKFRSYWFELWDFYESRRGAAEEWDRETTGRTFTAAQLG